MTESVDEQVRALAYEADPDNDIEWSEGSIGDKRPRRRLGAMVSVRFSPEELEEVRARAAAEGIPVSAFLRRRALEGGTHSAIRTANRSDLPLSSVEWKFEVASPVAGPPLAPGMVPNRAAFLT